MSVLVSGSAIILAANLGLAMAVQPVAPLLGTLPQPVAPLETNRTVVDFLHCLDEKNITLVSGHRGGPEPGYPENAIETFANTLSKGAFMLEVDVRQTADGVFVLMHDETLERTTSGQGRLDKTSWNALQELTLVDNDGGETAFRAPSLAEALAWAEGRAMLQLDVKDGVDIAELTRFVAKAGARDRAAIIAYTVEDALAAAKADPVISISVEITDEERLQQLIDGGLQKERLMAWTGVTAEPRPALWAMLERENVPAAFGSLWFMDNAVRESGDSSIYRRLAEMGVDVLSSDLHQLAHQEINGMQDGDAAVRACSARLSHRQDD